jgi:hypothetical protein
MSGWSQRVTGGTPCLGRSRRASLGWHEPDESRDSRPDLWGPRGAIPRGYPAAMETAASFEARSAPSLYPTNPKKHPILAAQFSNSRWTGFPGICRNSSRARVGAEHPRRPAHPLGRGGQAWRGRRAALHAAEREFLRTWHAVLAIEPAYGPFPRGLETNVGNVPPPTDYSRRPELQPLAPQPALSAAAPVAV